MREVITAPQKVKTINVGAEGSSDICYICSVVELYEVEGIVIDSDVNYDFDTNTIECTYSYPEGQEAGTTIRSYTLPIFLPTKNEEGNFVTPLTVKVTNNTTGETKSGEVKSSPDVIRPREEDQTPGYFDLGNRENVAEDTLRYFTAIGEVIQPDNTTTSEYYLFVITKTVRSHERTLASSIHEDDPNRMVYNYVEAVDPPSTNVSGAVSFQPVFDPTSEIAINGIQLEEGNASSINYNEPVIFYNELVTFD